MSPILTTLKFISIGDMVKVIVDVLGNSLLKEENLCIYCWTGKILGIQ
ncbi:MAG: Amidophosphoribosyltransferase [Thermoproteota archaeon]|nr:Amidophosphoribosyltransferase [Thermoproteota archaeon]